MKPTLVHRYSWPIREAIEQLLGDTAGDCDAWRIRVEGDELVIDVVAPAYTGRTIEVPDDFDVDKLCDMIVAGEFKMSAPAGRASIEEAPSIEMPVGPETDADNQIPDSPPSGQPERKGGPLAQRAGIICGEKGFWKFLIDRCGAVGIDSADSAAVAVRTRCGVTSRSELDHNAAAAENFRKIEGNYRLWLEGF